MRACGFAASPLRAATRSRLAADSQRAAVALTPTWLALERTAVHTLVPSPLPCPVSSRHPTPTMPCFARDFSQPRADNGLKFQVAFDRRKKSISFSSYKNCSYHILRAKVRPPSCFCHK
jgi:hypothetical protein